MAERERQSTEEKNEKERKKDARGETDENQGENFESILQPLCSFYPKNKKEKEK